MKNLFLFLKFGRIVTGLLLVVQIVYVIFTNNDLISFLEYPKSLTLALLCGFGYSLEKCKDPQLEKPNTYTKNKNDLNSNI